jgi:hypothetical protein
MRAYAWTLLLLAAACSKGPVLAEESPTPSAGAGSELGPISPDPIEAALCGRRMGCRLQGELRQPEVRSGGRDVVAIVHQPTGPHRPRRASFRFGVDPLPPAEQTAADAWETWLTWVGSNQAKPLQLLVVDGLPDDRAPVVSDLGPNRIRYTFSGNSGASHEYDIGLDPPHLERELHGGSDGSLSWSYESFAGDDCQFNDCAPLMLEASVKDEAFAREGWKTTGLGECAMRVDGITHGERFPYGRTSAVRLLLSGGMLYVEVTDDVFVTQGLVVDTLVFYSTFREAMPGYHSATLRLRMDGKLTDWQGKVRQVEAATGPSVRRFALTEVWPGPDENPWRLTYEDTDDGHSLRTGQSSGKNSHEPWVFVSPFACVPRDGVLHVDRNVVLDPERPIAP